MKKFYEDITIIIISYKSCDIVKNFIKKIPKKFKVIIVDNSNDLNLKKITKKYKNIKIFLRKNNGVSSALNFGVMKTNTKYFFQISPDVEFNFDDLKKFYKKAKTMNDNFSALGPRFNNTDDKSHKQSNLNHEIGYIKSIHGSAMFINKKNFKKIGKFDENIFLYFEETDYCKRGLKIGLKSYQLNKVKIKKKGLTVNVQNEKDKRKIANLLSWHFIWSKFYYFKKHYGLILSLIYFIPIIVRTIFKLNLTKNSNKYYKYKNRYEGLITAINGGKSYKRA